MKPAEFFEEMADVLVKISKRPFRTEDLTEAELDELSDQIMLLCASEKGKLCQTSLGN